MLQQFRSPEDVAVYYAAAKTLALVAFIYFSIAATTAHRVSAYHAAGDREGLADFLRKAIRWTFWPSLAATALLLAFGKPILALFGPQFTDGYHLMFILAVGLLARAAIGPMERFLNVIGQQRICALVYGGAFAINLVLCFVLIPPFGAAGAAIAISAALVVETIALMVIAKRRSASSSSLGAGATSGRSRLHGTIESGLCVEVKALDELASVASELRDLIARACEPNIFYEPAFVLAAAPVFGRDVLAGLVWRRSATTRLVGFFPVADRAPPLRPAASRGCGLDASLWSRLACRSSTPNVATPSLRPGSTTLPLIRSCRSCC